jgi:hypothetical protein
MALIEQVEINGVELDQKIARLEQKIGLENLASALAPREAPSDLSKRLREELEEVHRAFTESTEEENLETIEYYG